MRFPGTAEAYLEDHAIFGACALWEADYDEIIWAIREERMNHVGTCLRFVFEREQDCENVAVCECSARERQRHKRQDMALPPPELRVFRRTEPHIQWSLQ
jgi:hypothetical protein